MRLEKIYWRDICSLSGEWKSREDMITEAEELYDTEYISVGYVIYEDKNKIIVAATKDTSNEQEFNDASMIMKSVIIRREWLYTKDNLPG